MSTNYMSISACIHVHDEDISYLDISYPSIVCAAIVY